MPRFPLPLNKLLLMGNPLLLSTLDLKMAAKRLKMDKIHPVIKTSPPKTKMDQRGSSPRPKLTVVA